MATQPAQTFFQRLEQSFMSSIGAIVFGMEDGTVSIFGLVLGVAASATTSQTVLLAGATGAIAAAVSMMAGTYLDVSTERDQAQAAVATKQRAIQQHPQAETQKVHDQFKQAGFSDADTQTVMAIIQRTPGALLKTATAFELPIGPSANQNPWVQALWMFVADLFAAFVLLLLGIGRGVIGHKNVVATALQTLAIAAAAAAAGLLVSLLVTGQISG